MHTTTQARRFAFAILIIFALAIAASAQSQSGHFNCNGKGQCEGQQQGQTQSGTVTGTNTASGGSGGSATSSSGASSATNGPQSNAQTSNSTTTYQDVRQVGTAIASVPSHPFNNCGKGYGISGQGEKGGAALGWEVIDGDCEKQRLADDILDYGSSSGYCRMMLTIKKVKKSRWTYDDCIADRRQQQQAATVQAPAAPAMPPLSLTLNIPIPPITFPPAQVTVNPVIEKTTVMSTPVIVHGDKPAITYKKHAVKKCVPCESAK